MVYLNKKWNLKKDVYNKASLKLHKNNVKKEKELKLLGLKNNAQGLTCFSILNSSWNVYIEDVKYYNKDFKEQDVQRLKKVFISTFFQKKSIKTFNNFKLDNNTKKDGIKKENQNQEDLYKNWDFYQIYIKNLKNYIQRKDCKEKKKVFFSINSNLLYFKKLCFNLYLNKYFKLFLLNKKLFFVYFLKHLYNIIKNSSLEVWKDNIKINFFSKLNLIKEFNTEKSFQMLSVFWGSFTLKNFYGHLIGVDAFKTKINILKVKNIYYKETFTMVLQKYLIYLKQIDRITFFDYINFSNILFFNFVVKSIQKNILQYNSKGKFRHIKIYNFLNTRHFLNFKNKNVNENINMVYYKKQLKYLYTLNNYFILSPFFSKIFLKNFKYIYEKKTIRKLKFKNIQIFNKKSTLSLRKHLINSKFKKQLKHNLIERSVGKTYLFLLKRLEDKILRELDTQVRERLVQLRTFLYHNWVEKLKNQRNINFSVSNRKKIRKFNVILNLKWNKIYKFLFFELIQNKNLKKFNKINKILKKFYSKIKVGSFVKKNKILKKQRKKKKIRSWKQKRNKKGIFFQKKKLVSKNNYLPFKRQKELLYFLLNKKISIFYINALSLSRFGFLRGITKKSSNSYLQSIEREMIDRYKYVAIYIKDLVKISFISLFLKKASFLASFIAFQIEKLPRNRKETKFIRFIIKVVKIFAAQRKEMKGLRIKFKGRVNRWRRTKAIIGERGVLYFYTYASRIEYGSSKAITRKGALGISIWFAYNPVFKEELLSTIIDYQKYSKFLRWKTIKKFYNKFEMLKQY